MRSYHVRDEQKSSGPFQKLIFIPRDLPAIVFYAMIGNDVCTEKVDPDRYNHSISYC